MKLLTSPLKEEFLPLVALIISQIFDERMMGIFGFGSNKSLILDQIQGLRIGSQFSHQDIRILSSQFSG